MKQTATRIAGLLLTMAITLTVSGWIPFTAPVTIHSTPEGAPVYKAGSDIQIGTTPYKTFVFIWDRDYEVRMDKFYTEPVLLDCHSPKDIYVTLRPTPVLVYTKPSAELYNAESGERVGDTPMDVTVFTEDRNYVIKKDDYYSQDVTIGLETKNPQVIELKHRPLITINCAQDNVEIYENGSFLSKAPLSDEINTPRTFEFRKAGYYSKTLSISPAQTHELNYQTSVELEELPLIQIEATPASAEIYMAGKTSPLGKGKVTLKIAEKTTFTVKADRYYEESVTVDAKPQKATVSLKAMPYVTLSSSPSGATVSINGKTIGTTPLEQLAEKPITAKLTKDGYIPQTVTLTANNLKPTVTLKEVPPPPPPAPVAVLSTTPVGASVSIDGQIVGTTPFEKEIEGPVTVTITLEGYLPQTVTLDSTNLKPAITLEEEPKKSLSPILIGAIAVGIIAAAKKKKK